MSPNGGVITNMRVNISLSLSTYINISVWGFINEVGVREKISIVRMTVCVY